MLCIRHILLVLALLWGITCCSQVRSSCRLWMQSEEEENFYDSLAEVAPANSGGDFEDGVSGVFVEDQGSDLSQKI